MTTAVANGALVALSAVAGLFFLRFWRDTHDRFFLLFALAFWCLALNWLGLAMTRVDEVRTYFFVVRLFSFLLILAAIWDKNRPKRAPPSG